MTARHEREIGRKRRSEMVKKIGDTGGIQCGKLMPVGREYSWGRKTDRGELGQFGLGGDGIREMKY